MDNETINNISKDSFREYTGTVEFMQVVKKYAGEEIEVRFYKSLTLNVVLPILVTIATTFIIRNLFVRK